MLILAAGALALAACSSGGAGPGEDYGVFGDPITGNDQLNNDFCATVHECRASYPFAPEMFAAFFGNDVNECLAAGELLPETEQALLNAIAAGRATYSPENAIACDDALVSLNCVDHWNTAKPVCGAVFIGTIPAGGVCQVFAECMSQSCNLETGTCQ
jgi:hypothetical protein